MVRALLRIRVAEVCGLALLREDEGREGSESLAQHRALRRLEVVRNRLQVAHQSIHRPLTALGDRERRGLTVHPGEQGPQRVAQALTDEPERQGDHAYDEVQGLRAAVKEAIL